MLDRDSSNEAIRVLEAKAEECCFLERCGSRGSRTSSLATACQDASAYHTGTSRPIFDKLTEGGLPVQGGAGCQDLDDLPPHPVGLRRFWEMSTVIWRLH